MTWQTGKLWCTSSHIYWTIEQNPGSYSSANLGLNHPCSSWYAKEYLCLDFTPADDHSSNTIGKIWKKLPVKAHRHRKALYPFSSYLLCFLSHARIWAGEYSCTQQLRGAQTERHNSSRQPVISGELPTRGLHDRADFLTIHIQGNRKAEYA